MLSKILKKKKMVRTKAPSLEALQGDASQGKNTDQSTGINHKKLTSLRPKLRSRRSALLIVTSLMVVAGVFVVWRQNYFADKPQSHDEELYQGAILDLEKEPEKSGIKFAGPDEE